MRHIDKRTLMKAERTAESLRRVADNLGGRGFASVAERVTDHARTIAVRLLLDLGVSIEDVGDQLVARTCSPSGARCMEALVTVLLTPGRTAHTRRVLAAGLASFWACNAEHLGSIGDLFDALVELDEEDVRSLLQLAESTGLHPTARLSSLGLVVDGKPSSVGAMLARALRPSGG